MTDGPTYVLERLFFAPREQVWKTWVDPQLLVEWYGPNVETIIHKMDVEPGGLWLTEMKMSRGTAYQRAEYTEVTEPERIICLMSNADSNWNIVSASEMSDWPRVLKTTVTFEEVDGATRLRLEWTPHEGTDAENAFFEKMKEGMGAGWNAGMDLLADVLKGMDA